MKNKIILGDCIEVMKQFNDASVDLVITSPPYWNLKEYSYWDTYKEYLDSVNNWIFQCSRIIKDGRHVCWNIQSFLHDKVDGKRFHYPLSADTLKIAYKYDFMLEQIIIWHKPNGRNQRMFGSYPYPPTIIYTTNCEDILVLKKSGKASLENKNDESKLTLDEWKKYTLPLWTIPIDYTKRGHPAQYPEEIPSRCIKLHSFVGDIVLDPFLGSGTTAIACINTNRQFIGIEKDKKYFEIAKTRINEALQKCQS